MELKTGNVGTTTQESFSRGLVHIRKSVVGKISEGFPIGSNEIEIIVGDENQQLNIKSLLPDGWRIIEIPFGISRVNFDNNTIQIPNMVTGGEWKGNDSFVKMNGRFEEHRFLKTRGSLLSLLHEIAHVYTNKNLSQEDRNKLKVLEELDSREITLDDINIFVNIKIPDERNAWARALKQLSELKEKGINLEPEMSRGDMIKYVEECYTTYAGIVQIYIAGLEAKSVVVPKKLKELVIRWSKFALQA